MPRRTTPCPLLAGANKFVAMNDEGDVASVGKSLDLILDTVSVDHEVMAYNGMLDVNGTHVLLGFLKNLGVCAFY